MTQHTPGPWRLRADMAITAFDAETEEQQPIARAYGDGSIENLYANSRLIAAAPELLEALRWYVDTDEVSDSPGNEFWLEGRERARAVIRKADPNGDKEGK